MAYTLGTRHVNVQSLFAPQALTTTTNGGSIDMKGNANAGTHEIRVHGNIGAVSGTTPTLTIQIQDSPDNSTFTNVSGAVTASLTAAGSFDVYFKSLNRYIRAVATIGGTTPSFTLSVDLYSPLRNV